jgi:hypothetical protein
VYGGFLPRVPFNAAFAREQLRRLRAGETPSDFWTGAAAAGAAAAAAAGGSATVEAEGGSATGGALAEHLLGIDVFG